MFFAVVPTLANTCCISPISALDLLATIASVAESLAAFFAPPPQMFIACCTVVAVADKSSPETAAAFAIAGNSFFKSLIDAPFRAISTIAFPASSAEIGNVLPSDKATFSKSFMLPLSFLLLEPAITAALLIVSWKSPYDLIALPAAAPTAKPTTVEVLPIFCIDPPTR